MEVPGICNTMYWLWWLLLCALCRKCVMYCQVSILFVIKLMF